MYVNLPVHTVKGVPAGTSSTVIGQFFLLQRYRLAHFANIFVTTPHCPKFRATFREIERRVDGMKLHGEKYFGEFFRVNKLLPSCAADFSLLNLPKGKSLGRSKPATSSYAQAPQHTVWDDSYYIQALLNCLL
jgi:hypothetical protein